jgi:hypothetical protein
MIASQADASRLLLFEQIYHVRAPYRALLGF